jgi:hypothetical protein
MTVAQPRKRAHTRQPKEFRMVWSAAARRKVSLAREGTYFGRAKTSAHLFATSFGFAFHAPGLSHVPALRLS